MITCIVREPQRLVLEIAIRTHSPNGNRSWRVVGRHRKTLRTATKLSLLSAFGQAPAFVPSSVVITRRGPRKMDSDNAAFAVKGARDAVADWIGIDDGDDAVEWTVKREIGEFAVKIEISATRGNQ